MTDNNDNDKNNDPIGRRLGLTPMSSSLDQNSTAVTNIIPDDSMSVHSACVRT